MTERPVRLFTRSDGIIEYYTIGIEGWDECEALVAYIAKHFGARTVEQLDGIYTRRWTLCIGETEVIVQHHDDVGNYFYGKKDSPGGEAVAAKIASHLTEQLRKVRTDE